MEESRQMEDEETTNEADDDRNVGLEVEGASRDRHKAPENAVEARDDVRRSALY